MSDPASPPRPDRPPPAAGPEPTSPATGPEPASPTAAAEPTSPAAGPEPAGTPPPPLDGAPDRKLTSYFGERDRVGSRLLADELALVYARHRIRTSVVLRGHEGFGPRHRLQSEGLEVLSLDLPLVSIAVDSAERIAALQADVLAVQPTGMVTVERARILGDDLSPGGLASALAPLRLSERTGEEVKLTVQLGRQERADDGRLAYHMVVDELHRAGVAGATVLLGIDGTAHGERHRATFLSRNREVPLLLLSVGDADAITRAVGRIGPRLRRPLLTVERARICKRDGRRLAAPPVLADEDGDGLGVWQKLTVYGSSLDHHGQRPVHQEIVRGVREAGGTGATTLQGIWGYHGDHAPHGDRFLQLQRRVPLVTTIVDRPSRIAALFAVVDRCCDRAGLVTSEIVPARHLTSPARRHGGLLLSSLAP